jgi:hypothetical protein
MEEKSEKVAKKDDRLLTINKEKEEMMKEVTVKQKKPYVAPTCEVIKLEGGDLLNGWGLQASIQEAEDGGEILDAKKFEFSEEDINMNASWND